MKSSPSIWHYVVIVKSTVKILSIFVAFLENMNFQKKKSVYPIVTYTYLLTASTSKPCPFIKSFQIS